MAASLKSYGFKEFEYPKKSDGATDLQIDDAFHARLDFIGELPVAAFDKLQQLVHDFDTKISAVFAEGAPEDF